MGLASHTGDGVGSPKQRFAHSLKVNHAESTGERVRVAERAHSLDVVTVPLRQPGLKRQPRHHLLV